MNSSPEPHSAVASKHQTASLHSPTCYAAHARILVRPAKSTGPLSLAPNEPVRLVPGLRGHEIATTRAWFWALPWVERVCEGQARSLTCTSGSLRLIPACEPQHARLVVVRAIHVCPRIRAVQMRARAARMHSHGAVHCPSEGGAQPLLSFLMVRKTPSRKGPNALA